MIVIILGFYIHCIEMLRTLIFSRCHFYFMIVMHIEMHLNVRKIIAM